MGRYEIRTRTWSSGPVGVASTHRQRRLGMRYRVSTAGLALGARSVHTFGMTTPISVIACNRIGRVIRAARLRPRRIFFAARAALIVEVLTPALPEKGERVEVFRLGEEPGDWSLETGA